MNPSQPTAGLQRPAAKATSADNEPSAAPRHPAAAEFAKGLEVTEWEGGLPAEWQALFNDAPR